MKDQDKSKAQLLSEINDLKEHIKDLEDQFHKKITLSDTQQNGFSSLFEKMKSNIALLESVNNGSEFKIKEFFGSLEKNQNGNKSQFIGKPITSAFPGIGQSRNDRNPRIGI